MKKLSAFFLLAISLGGCAAPPQQHIVQNSRVYDSNFDTTWTHLIQFLASRNIQLKTIEKASGVVYAEKASIETPGLVDCGTPGIISILSTTGNLNVLVVPDGAKTKVTVNITYNQMRQFDKAVFPAKCFSTGVLEQEILDAL